MADEPEGLKVLKKEQMGQLALTVKVSKDKLVLYLDANVVPSKDKMTVDKETLKLMLKDTAKPEFLNLNMLDIIASSVNQGKSLKDRKVAQGSLPENAQDGRFEAVVKPVEIPAKPEDMRFVRDMGRVVPGMILGLIHPPTEGKPGVDIFGEQALPKPGKPLKLLLDKSLEQKQSQKEGAVEYVVARAHGFLVKEKDRLKVVHTLTLKKEPDVTLRTVNCNGGIEINGDVAKGLTVQARNDLAIKGRTFGSKLVSQLGSIRVTELVVGGPGLPVIVGGDANIYMTQNLNLSADGNVIIGKDARDSSIETNGALVMKNGHLFGGQALALGGIEAEIIGSDGGTVTVVGCKSKAQVEAEIAKLTELLTEHQTNEEALKQKIAPFGVLGAEKLPVFEPQHCRRINEFLLKLDEAAVLRQILENRLHKLQEALAHEPWFQVNFKKVLHKGVVIRVGDDERVIDPYITGPATIEYSATTRKFKDNKYHELPALKPHKKTAGEHGEGDHAATQAQGAATPKPQAS